MKNLIVSIVAFTLATLTLITVIPAKIVWDVPRTFLIVLMVGYSYLIAFYFLYAFIENRRRAKKIAIAIIIRQKTAYIHNLYFIYQGDHACIFSAYYIQYPMKRGGNDVILSDILRRIKYGENVLEALNIII